MDVERVAGGDPVELPDIDPGVDREAFDAGPAERFSGSCRRTGSEATPPRIRSTLGASPSPSRWVTSSRTGSASIRLGQEGQEIERGLIGPLDVFDDQDPQRPEGTSTSAASARARLVTHPHQAAA